MSLEAPVRDSLSSFFRAGLAVEDVAALHPLLRAQAALQALTTLFRGGDEEVVIRLLVLREIGIRGDQPRWSPQSLRQHFAYLDETKFETVLSRLRDHALLVWDGDTGEYEMSPPGRMALAAVSTLLKFSDEGGELGYITAQLAAGQAVGRVSVEELQHLLSRLNELQEEFNRAILSGSEFLIRRAEQKLNAVWQWVEKGTEVIRGIAENADLDTAAHRVAQRIGQVQSRMLRMGSMFQRALNQLESQQVHLGATGLSSADITRWLRDQGMRDIAALMEHSLTFVPQPTLVVSDIAADAADYELTEKQRADLLNEALPEGRLAPQADDIATEEEDLQFLDDWVAELRALAGDIALAEAVPLEGYALSAYRLSLLSLLGDPDSAALTGAVADLARSPLRVEWQDQIVQIGRDGVAEMSAGKLRIGEQTP